MRVVEETWRGGYENLINREEEVVLRGKKEVERLDSYWKKYFLVMILLEHMCIVVLGFIGTKCQETKRFLRARKPAGLLVG
jgi:hypothetical protein